MDFSYSISDIANITKGNLIEYNDAQSIINDLIIDSRKFVAGRQSLFVALVSDANDGHKYIYDLYQRGVRNFLVSNIPEDEMPLANIVLVDDSLQALQKLSIYHRNQFHYPVIGITGSNGKTIVKEWLYQVISPDKKVVRSPKSFNSQIGVPLSVLQMSDDYDLAIFEAGISQPDEMDNLQKIIIPDIGIITNIGHAHDENFVDNRQKINEKIQLFKKCKKIIYCRDHGEINQRIFSIESFRDKEIVSWSLKNEEGDLFVQHNKEAKGKGFSCSYKGSSFTIDPPFKDNASIENIFQVVLTALELGVKIKHIQERVKKLASIAMRLELKEGVNNCSIINDVYNSDLNSIAIAMDFLSQQNQHRHKTVILSDILQSGMNEFTLYSRVADLIDKMKIDTFIGIGLALKRQQNLFKCDTFFYDTTDDFLHYHPTYNLSNQTLLLKGARKFEFEKISNRLQQKVHQTVMEINLTALVENLNFYKTLLRPKTKIMAMVKAFSYGSGSFEIANALRYHNVDYLAVAYADEGVELRKAGITLPIMVMNPDANAFDLMIVNNLEPEIYNLSILEKLITLAEQSILPKGKSVGIHIKIDSGMHRLGFEVDELPALIDRIKNVRQVEIRSAFTHLVGSDTPDFDDFTVRQAAVFASACKILEKELGSSFIKHILNSAGICRFPDLQLDMVRLGIGLYGFGACPNQEQKLRNVSSLKSIVTQIKHIKKGESVGYNRSYTAPHDIISATIPIGYADGFDRRLSQGVGKVLIHGKFAPVIGNVCMDMTMVDVTNIEVKEGDEVFVFNEEFTISQMASLIGTIPYEVMTSISRRVKRVYYQE